MTVQEKGRLDGCTAKDGGFKTSSSHWARLSAFLGCLLKCVSLFSFCKSSSQDAVRFPDRIRLIYFPRMSILATPCCFLIASLIKFLFD